MDPSIETVAVLVALSPGLIRQLHTPHGMLRITIERRGSAVVLYAGGAVDTSNEQVWQQLLGEAGAVTAAPGPLVIDTNGLDFMALCTFKALAQQADRCRRRSLGLRLVSRQPIVARWVARGGLTAKLPIYPSVDAALSAA
jgi:anti-anti-sigma factor